MAENHDEDSCGICLGTKTNPVELPCQHSFCAKCIEEMQKIGGKVAWAQRCPLCRAPISGVEPDNDSESHSEEEDEEFEEEEDSGSEDIFHMTNPPFIFVNDIGPWSSHEHNIIEEELVVEESESVEDAEIESENEDEFEPPAVVYFVEEQLGCSVVAYHRILPGGTYEVNVGTQYALCGADGGDQAADEEAQDAEQNIDAIEVPGLEREVEL